MLSIAVEEAGVGALEVARRATSVLLCLYIDVYHL